MTQQQQEILFIGSFNLPENGHYGGVFFASSSLRNKLEQEGIKVIELDTTLKDISVTKVSKRILSIIARAFRFLHKIFFSPKAKTLFVFISGGNSYIDKLPSVFLARLLRKRVVVFPRSGHIIPDFEKPFYSFFIRSVFNNSSSIICQSAYWRDYFKSKHIDEKKLKIIENWVPDETIAKSERLQFKNFDVGSEEVFTMIFVSRIERDKGVLDLIEVAKLLSNRIKFKIDIYGNGSFKNELLELIDQENLGRNVCYKGWLGKNDMQEVINSYHLALFTSRIEGYPNSLLDFIFSKVPIIAYRIPAVEAVGNGSIYYYDNDISFADNIIYCHNNYNEASLNAMKIYEEKKENNKIEFAFNQLIQYQ